MPSKREDLMIIYPRIHGEHNPARLFKAVDNGSSPYARGTQRSK